MCPVKKSHHTYYENKRFIKGTKLCTTVGGDEGAEGKFGGPEKEGLIRLPEALSQVGLLELAEKSRNQAYLLEGIKR